MDTNEVILLQTLNYFRKKIEALEGESYRADELDFCYNSLHEDYVKKCAEYNALEVSYDKLAEVSEAEISKLKKEIENWQDKYNVCSERVIELQERVEDKTFKDEINGNYIKNLEAEVAKLKKENIDLEKENDEYSKDFSELNRKYQALKKEKESATWEWSVLKTEKNDAESRYIDMKNNMEDLVKDYDNLYEENIKLKQALDMRMTECDELKGKNFILEDLIKKGEEHYKDKYCCDAFEEMEDIIEDLKNDKKNLQYDCDILTSENDSLNDQVKMLIAEKKNLIQKLQNINDEYLILHNDKNQLEKEVESLKNQINFEKEYEATWGKVDMANITDVVCGDINEVTTPISSEEADVLAYMAGWEKAGY